MPNVSSVINNHNKFIQQELTKPQTKTCLKRDSCSLINQCLTTNIVYEAHHVRAAFVHTRQKPTSAYAETRSRNDTQIIRKLFNHSQYGKQRKLSKEVEKEKEPKI